MSKTYIVRYVLDNKGVTQVPNVRHIWSGVILKKVLCDSSMETYQCPLMTGYHHIIAVRIFVGLPIDPDTRQSAYAHC